MAMPWALFIDLGVISAALLIATFIRARIPFFQRFFIPNALTAGFLLLIFYNTLLPLTGLSSENLGHLVYHLLSISFIAMTLRKAPRRTRTVNVFTMSVGILSQYALQALTGLFLTLLFIKTLFPDLFPSFGLFIPLGFSLGPGQALSIGQSWEPKGFVGASSVGLTFAAIGFLWACFGGVFLVNIGIRKGWIGKTESTGLEIKKIKTGLLAKGETGREGSRLTTQTEAIDSLTFHLAVVLAVYLVTFLLLKGLYFVLSLLGPKGIELAENFWSISFVFAAFMALLAKFLISKFKGDHLFDNDSLTRIAGVSVDLMVAAALGAISLVVVAQYWFPLLVMCLIAGVLTLVAVPWIGSRLFKDHKFHRTLILFGVATGTLTTGLALLRIIDPDFKTPVASDYMYAMGMTFFLAIPFIMAINLPTRSYTTGNPLYFWLTIGAGFLYLLYVIISFSILVKRPFHKPFRLWAGLED